MKDRPRALTVLIAVFLLGGILGSAGMYMYCRKELPPERRRMQNFSQRPGMGRPRSPEFLHLTPEQEAKFSEIMNESYRQLDKLRVEQGPLIKQLDELRTEQEPRIQAIFGEMNRKLMAVLSPDQQQKFSAFLKETDKWRRRPPFGGRGMQPGMQQPPPH
jgi:hypothetical protein